MTELDMEKEVASQVQTVAIICETKARFVNKAILLTSLALALYIIALAPAIAMGF